MLPSHETERRRSPPLPSEGTRGVWREGMVMFGKLLSAIAIAALIVSVPAQAQNRPQQPQRPPWQDVCCGGPCCKAKTGR